MTTVRILPTRTHRLAGQRLEAGVPANVDSADAELALRHGWAVAAPKAAGASAKRGRESGPSKVDHGVAEPTGDGPVDPADAGATDPDESGATDHDAAQD